MPQAVASVNPSTAFGEWLLAVVTFAALLVLFAVLSLGIASAEWALIGAILGVFIGFALATRGVYVLALVWILGIPTLFNFPNRFLAAIPGLSVERLLFIAIVATLVLGRVFRRRPVTPLIRVEVWCLVFLGIAFASLLGHLPDTLAGVRVNVALFLQGYLMPLGAFFIARRLDWTRERLEQILGWLVAVGIFLAISAVLQQFFNVTVFIPQSPGSGELINAARASGTFGNPFEFGAVITTLIIIALLQSVRQHRARAMAAFYLSTTAFMAVALILTKTRGSWIAALVALATLFAGDRRVRPVFIVGGIAAGVAGAVMLVVFWDPALWRNRLGDTGPIFNRLTAYATAVNAIAHNPLLGMGFTRNAFTMAKEGYITGIGSLSAYWATFVGVPHNEFLHVGLLTGLPGLGAYLLVIRGIYKSLSNLSRVAGDPLARDFALYVRAVLVCFVANALLIDFIFSTYFTMLLYFLAGAAIRYGEDSATRPLT